jgi:hypothetical protein
MPSIDLFVDVVYLPSINLSTPDKSAAVSVWHVASGQLMLKVNRTIELYLLWKGFLNGRFSLLTSKSRQNCS